MPIEKTDFEKVFERMETLAITTQRKLAKILNITPSAVSCAKRGGKFPRGWAEEIGQKFDVSVDFLLTGQYKGTPTNELIDRLILAEKRNTELKQQLKEQELLLKGLEDRPIQSLNGYVSP